MALTVVEKSRGRKPDRKTDQPCEKTRSENPIQKTRSRKPDQPDLRII